MPTLLTGLAIVALFALLFVVLPARMVVIRPRRLRWFGGE